MDTSIVLVVVLVASIATFAYFLHQLNQRIQFLEHEVRWLRSELEALKPTEVRSKFD